jgi:CheY-like chemotaxis protein
MGGTIGCESEPGLGSRFWFTLPYISGAGLESDILVSDLTGTRMLIVDGDDADRRALESSLASWGISPDGAGDGPRALQLLRHATESGRPFAAALISATLPGMDGLELVRQIKDTPALRSTRLLLAVTSPAEVAGADVSGVDAHLAKPIRPSRLYNQLLATMHKGRPGQPVIGAAREIDGPAGETGLRVLVAEDNEVGQFAAIRLLRTFGLTVDVAANGREAITRTGRTDYAAVFMDCQMPDVDGYTATRVIRRREEQSGRHTPIIALTAHALDGDRQKCLDAGMDDYLAKPLRRQSVREILDRLAASATGADDADTRGVFDPAPLNDIGDPETEAALATMFLDQSAERLPALRAAIAADDAAELHGLAHGLKGSAATVGATRMSEIAEELCELASGGKTSGALALHSELTDALVQTSAALTGLTGRAGRAGGQ